MESEIKESAIKKLNCIDTDRGTVEINSISIPIQIGSWHTQWILVERLYTEFAKRYDLTSSAVFVLRTIFEHPIDCTQRYICDALIYPKQTVSSIIQTLIKKGIAAKRQSQEDKRNFDLYLTKEGMKFTFHMLEELKQAETDAFKALLPEDREHFTQINEALTKALHTAMHIES
ncbi:MAG: MarR family transcriptional regulator [Anaerocolumna sp.]